jgi:hypothetical protein
VDGGSRDEDETRTVLPAIDRAANGAGDDFDDDEPVSTLDEMELDASDSDGTGDDEAEMALEGEEDE